MLDNSDKFFAAVLTLFSIFFILLIAILLISSLIASPIWTVGVLAVVYFLFKAIYPRIAQAMQGFKL